MVRSWKRLFLVSAASHLSAAALTLLLGCNSNAEPQAIPPVQPESAPAATEPAPPAQPEQGSTVGETEPSKLQPLSVAIPESSHRFRMQIKGDITTKIQETPELAVIANTLVQYRWKRMGNVQQLFVASQQVSAEMNGQLVMETTMSRERFSMRNQEGLTDIAFEEANPELQQLLIDSHEKPLCDIRIDDWGRKVERTDSANAGAKDTLANGVVENTRICHPPFPGTDTWEAPCAISMGNGNFTRGNLQYKIVGNRSEHDKVDVEVSGQLTGSGKQGILEIRNAVHAVRGSQVYDVARREWLSADLHIDVGFDLYQDAEKVGHATGTMKLTMSIQDDQTADQN